MPCCSFTNHSLYTSFQSAECVFFNAWASSLGSIETDYGLDNLNKAATLALFWDALRNRLLARVAEFTKEKDYAYAAVTVLTTGEAADHPGFLDVVRDVVEEIPRVRGEHGATRKHQAELVVSDDPSYTAARGAAFWLRTRMDWSYCAVFDDETVWGLDEAMANSGHTEL